MMLNILKISNSFKRSCELPFNILKREFKNIDIKMRYLMPFPEGI